MFTLTSIELNNAYSAISHHGYSTMLPDPPEWDVVIENWQSIREILERIDLDTYEPFKLMRVFAPKSRATIRVMHMLHPQDLLIYTALILIAKNYIETNRVPVKTKRVFSYRADITKPQVLCGAKGSHDVPGI